MASIDSENDNNSLANYVSYQDVQTGRSRVGHYNLNKQTIQPLTFISGTSLDNLYQVIEAGELNLVAAGEPFPASSAKILPPFTGRDVLCVGKNYADHAKEFNSSGFDSSDKVDTPSHPVIFTKRFTSIIADGEEVFPHREFTETIDYEGEVGVIIGKAGFCISEADATDHVWGYTIVNDITARERQRDHKQFYIGKSPDTFCPMGPIAVPASKLDQVLRIQTHVNGELRQSATTDDLIFSIPFLIKTMSEGQTLMPGDVLATGTPAGVGIGKKPPVYLNSGDTVAVSVTGLGTLTNRIGDLKYTNPIVSRVANVSHIQKNNVSKSIDPTLLTQINDKPLYYKKLGDESGPPVVFVHGLGGSSEFWMPLIQSLGIANSHSLHVFDLEGQGLSPTSPLSKLSIGSSATDLDGVFEEGNITFNGTLVAHGMGCWIAVKFALAHPHKVSKLILMGCPPSALAHTSSVAIYEAAETLRTKGMISVVDSVVDKQTSEKTKTSNPLAIAAVRMSLLSQDHEGYAKASTALANAPALNISAVQATTLFITGSEDKVSPSSLWKMLVKRMNGKASLQVLEGVGHWHVFEDLEGVTKAIRGFL